MAAICGHVFCSFLALVLRKDLEERLAAGLAETVPAVSRYLLEPRFRDDLAFMQRLAEPPHPDSGAFHFDNQTDQRGGFSVYVPPWYDPSKPTPLIMALHGGSGHGLCSCGTGCRRPGRGALSLSRPPRSAAPGL